MSIISKLITITISGVEYPARLPLSALAEVEEITGESFLKVFNEFGIDTILKLTYAALKGGGVEIEFEDLRDNDFSVEDMNELTEKVNQLIHASMPDPESNDSVELSKNKKKKKKKNRSR